MSNPPIKLNDVLHLSDEQIQNTKLRFMRPNKDVQFDPNKDAEDYQKHDDLNLVHLVNNGEKIHFKKDTIAIGFINIRDNQWLMTGIVRVLHDNGRFAHANAEYMTKKYNFRIVVGFRKTSRQGVLLAKNFIDSLDIIEVWNPDIGVGDKTFPGYKNVKVGFEELKKVLDESEQWRTALRCRKGIYLISDTATGKLYVGSAYGSDGILGRWNTYLKSGYDKNELENGKYPNKEFQTIVKNDGLDYIKNNFQYSILETFTDDVSNEIIIARESWWKEVLLSRIYGYNRN